MYTHDLAALMDVADALLGTSPLVCKKPSAAYLMTSDNVSPRGSATEERRAAPTRRRLREPTFDWEAVEGGVVLHAATPGLKKQDLSVEIRDEGAHRYLIVSGGTKDPAADEAKADASSDKAEPGPTPAAPAADAAAMPCSYYYAAFEHRMRLPAGITSDSMTAKYEDGVLTLHLELPKPKPPQSQTITIA